MELVAGDEELSDPVEPPQPDSKDRESAAVTASVRYRLLFFMVSFHPFSFPPLSEQRRAGIPDVFVDYPHGCPLARHSRPPRTGEKEIGTKKRTQKLHPSGTPKNKTNGCIKASVLCHWGHEKAY
jgi:hypothetical protein